MSEEAYGAYNGTLLGDRRVLYCRYIPYNNPIAEPAYNVTRFCNALVWDSIYKERIVLSVSVGVLHYSVVCLSNGDYTIPPAI